MFGEEVGGPDTRSIGGVSIDEEDVFFFTNSTRRYLCPQALEDMPSGGVMNGLF